MLSIQERQQQYKQTYLEEKNQPAGPKTNKKLKARKNSRKNKTALIIDATKLTGETIISPNNVIAAARQDLERKQRIDEYFKSDDDSSQELMGSEHQHHLRQ